MGVVERVLERSSLAKDSAQVWIEELFPLRIKERHSLSAVPA
jgi:hypothetical protein